MAVSHDDQEPKPRRRPTRRQIAAAGTTAVAVAASAALFLHSRDNPEGQASPPIVSSTAESLKGLSSQEILKQKAAYPLLAMLHLIGDRYLGEPSPDVGGSGIILPFEFENNRQKITGIASFNNATNENGPYSVSANTDNLRAFSVRFSPGTSTHVRALNIWKNKEDGSFRASCLVGNQLYVTSQEDIPKGKGGPGPELTIHISPQQTAECAAGLADEALNSVPTA